GAADRRHTTGRDLHHGEPARLDVTLAPWGVHVRRHRPTGPLVEGLALMNPASMRRASGWAAAATVLLLAACTPSSPPTPTVTRVASQDLTDLGHVHDVQVAPLDHTILVATHTGVWTIPDPFGDEPRQLQRAGEGRQDTM